ncbi:MAG: non-ribosomal peptide synthase/polyketide synthase [Alphaproteobacteria bacterium]|jgi:amino acid adenylation domain-containing protein|nr:non-ribosomal peptide synthase/polyketide synthase [Alphaproteobacteria bacterium]MBT5390060.1 non-ribosomal peptide synthase/polyketide synthase [Alphaproteobacteria bacterium]
MSDIETLSILSPLQEGLLFRELYTKGAGGEYIVQTVIHLHGKIDSEAVQIAWEKITQAHDILRTGFVWENVDHPIQYTLNKSDLFFSTEDWSKLSEKSIGSNLSSFLEQDRSTPFNLSSPPLFRVKFLKLPKNSYYIVWTCHHILLDGWSSRLILNDFFSAYCATLEKKQPNLAVDSYTSYLQWIEKQDKDCARDFWVKNLQNIEEPSLLKLSQATEKKTSQRNFISPLPETLWENVQKYAQLNNYTINTLVQATIGLVLSQLMNKRNISYGVTISGRSIDLKNVQNIPGLLINTLPLSIGIDRTRSVRTYLDSLQLQTLSINEHSSISLAEVQKNSFPGEKALFDTILVFENYPSSNHSQFENYGFSIKSIDIYEKNEFPLTFVFFPGQSPYLELNYQTSLFLINEIERISELFQETLKNLISVPPSLLLQEVSSFSDKEKEKILSTWNNFKIVPQKEDLLIHQIFEQQAEKKPDRVALLHEGQHVTYAQLNQRAYQLAHYLKEKGVGPETFVAVGLERGIPLITSILAILKTGGAYVPLDLSLPKERLKFILNDSNACCLITEKKYSEYLLDFSGTCIDFLSIPFSSLPNKNLPDEVHLDSSIYLTYTSGTTGTPKGIINSQRGLLNRFLWSLSYYNINQTEIFLQNASIGFDISYWELVLPLLVGSKLVIPTDKKAKDPLHLYQLLIKEKVTLSHFVPSLLSQLLEFSKKNTQHRFLRKLICGGEVVPKEDLNQFLTLFPQAHFHHAYGPTEAAISVTYWDIKKGPYLEPKLPIGRPINKTKIYILNEALNPVPIGIIGDIYIAGDGLARGYINQPDLTADKYIANPFATQEDVNNFQNLRLYKTGDLGKYLSDGNIDFCGRIDSQVKIRGYRIELGEIEHALSASSLVHQAIILAHKEAKHQELIAYLLLTPQTLEKFSFPENASFSVLTSPSIGKITKVLRLELEKSLPDYMIPAHFIFLNEFPINSNGKIDRKRLPTPDKSRRTLEQNYVEPRNEIEQDLCLIWQEILGLNKIGIHDNFFEIGGHSLLATQIISRLRSQFQLELSLRDIFEYPTISVFATLITQSLRNPKDLNVPPILPATPQDLFPLSFAQQRLWFLEELTPNSSVYNIPMVFELSGPLNILALHKAFQKIIQRHSSLRTFFIKKDGVPFQKILADLDPFELVDLNDTENLEDHLSSIKHKHAHIRFDLSKGPLLQLTLLKAGPEKNFLFITMHHIISDGWSVGIFNQELSILYRAYISDQDIELPLLAIQYTDFTLWQHAWLQGKTLQKQLTYWQEKLKNLPDSLNLPADFPRPKTLSYKGKRYQHLLNKDLSLKVKSLCLEENVSTYMFLLTTFNVLLHKYSGDEDIIVGSPISNRTHKDIEGLIGFFVNTIVFRSKILSHSIFYNLLLDLKEQSLTAYRYQDIPFEQLVDHLNIERSLNKNPIFQMRFVYQKQSGETLDLEGISSQPIHTDYEASKFDLLLHIYEKKNSDFSISVEYMSDLYKDETIKRFAHNYEALLESIVSDLHTPIHRLNILPQKEQSLLFNTWNNTSKKHDESLFVHNLFEEQVQKNPDRIALVFKNQHVTYEQLNQWANKLSHYLKEQGAAPETFVAILMDRSIDFVVSLIAVLKTGGAYLPLDPSLPPQRLSYILNDSAPSLILSNKEQPSYIQENTFVNISTLNLTTEPNNNPLHQLHHHNPIYLIYTSGTTGKPKGVIVSHGALSNYAKAILKKISAASQIGYCSNPSTDLGNTTLFASLIGGKTLHIFSEGEELDSQIFLEKVLEKRLNLIKLTPSHLQILSEKLSSATSHAAQYFKNNMLCVVGGEALSPSLINARDTINHYGPTETSVGVTTYACKTEELGGGVPIGSPLQNIKIYLLDSASNPVPIGAIGEIYIAGDGLARGYLNQASLTAEKFIANPFATQEDINTCQNLRLYKTGDLGKYLPDGNITFCGRTDHQVKIRGHRIELDEISSLLQNHEDLQTCTVKILEDGSIAAYIIPGSFEPTETELTTYLEQFLPNYMVPSSFIFLDCFPLTTSGKIDYKKLPTPDKAGHSLKEKYVAPRTEIEQAICLIWQEVLELKQIGVHDNFFKIGGHSLLATQIISRIRSQFQLELPLRDIFEYPTISTFSTLITQSLRNPKDLNVPPILPAPHQALFPLSFAQQRLWFLEELDPNVSAYNIPMALEISGPLNIQALSKALKAVIQRHNSLRTVFIKKNGVPFQKILPTIDSIETVELTDANDIKNRLSHIKKDHAHTKFNLSEGPLIRITCLKASSEKTFLFITLHHIISDGWSIGVFNQELSSFYKKYLQKKDPEPFSLPIQYTDFTIWQHSWLQGDPLQRQLSYWKSKLDSLPDSSNFPTDFPRPKTLSYKGERYRYALNKELSLKIKSLCLEENISIYMFLLTAFNVLLHKYSGDEDIIVGTPVANRNHKDIEGLIGFFVNTLVFRSNISPHKIFYDLLLDLKEQSLTAYQYQDVPFEQLVDHLNIERALNKNPIFQIMFMMQNANESSRFLELGGTEISYMSHEENIAKFDLEIIAHEDPKSQCIGLTIEYMTDLYKSETIEKFAGHYKSLLKEITLNLQAPVHTLNILLQKEQSLLLNTWNDTNEEYGELPFAHKLFQQQAQKNPDRIALVFDGKHVTYEQLNQQANRLAHYLKAEGVGPETFVAVLMDRSVDLIVSFLAILKSGGAYVPLDPNTPVTRNLWFLEQVKPSVLILGENYRKTYTGKIKTPEIFATQFHHKESFDPSFNENLNLLLNPLHIAYVIYTSGSTGTPKGTAVHHLGMHNHIKSKIKDLKITAQDTIAQTSTQIFDISIWQMLTSLTLGAKEVIFSQNEILDIKIFSKVFSLSKISILEHVPSYTILFLEELKDKTKKSPFRYLKHYIVTGEALTPLVCSTLLDTDKKLCIVNAYGPTECSDDVTHYFLTSHPGKEFSIPIGKPINNTKIYILDKALSPVPIGIVGEVYIAGNGLARGYLNQPDLTADRFIANPFATQENINNPQNLRLYKTGDLGKYLPDGNIDFCGRIDHQVKIRGYRIELGEIEHALSASSLVHQAIVVAHKDTKNQELLAYILLTPKTLEELSPLDNNNSSALTGSLMGKITKDLRLELEATLPDYMMPAHFIFLNEFPLTSNGKIDRKKLPVPDKSKRTLEQNYVEPRNEIEQNLCLIWQEVLGLNRIGIHDNFFEIGGHSLLATQIISRLHSQFQLELPLRDIFEHPTISAFSTLITKALRNPKDLNIPPILPASPQDLFPLSFSQQRLWFLEELTPDASVYNIPIALELSGLIDIQALTKAFKKVIQRHDSLRTIFIEKDGVPFQKVLPTIDPIETIELTDKKDLQKKISQTKKDHSQTRFNLSEGPLIRITILMVSPEKTFLFITMHHIISDGWSIGIFNQEISTLYKSYLLNQEPELPLLAIQYTDFTLWQHTWLQEKTLQKQLTYWQDKLKNLPDSLNLPTDFPRPKTLSYKGKRFKYPLNKDLSLKIKFLCLEENVSTYMFLLTAFNVLLHKYSGDEDIIVGTPIANRAQKELEELIGFFINTLVFRSNVSPHRTFHGLLQDIKAQSLSAYQYQDVPFEQLVDHLNIERSLNKNPIFQVRFVYQKQTGDNLTFEGTSSQPIHTEHESAKFDFLLHIYEQTDSSFSISVEYMTDLYRDETITQFAQHYETLLKSIVSELHTPIHRLNILPQKEQTLLLNTWNNTAKKHGNFLFVHKLFEQQAQKNPDHIALVFENQQITYKQLNQRANKLSHYLKEQGAGPETFIAILMDRSIDFFVSLIATLKAGSAYIPLDPNLPPQRLAYILKDSNPHLILSNKEQPSYIQENTFVNISTLGLRTQSHESPLVPLHPHNPIYLIYTSGTTGKPKGVIISHEALSNYTEAILKKISAASQVGYCNAPSTDIGNTTLFTSLTGGKTLHIFSEGEELDSQIFLEKVFEKRLDLLKLTPSHLQILSEKLSSATSLMTEYFKKHMTCIIGGEELKSSLIHAKKTINHYGPTETSVGVTTYACKEEETGQIIPIGNPLQNTRIYLLDISLNPVPIGVIGEIYIAGNGLARGYLNQPNLTAKKFIANPFATQEDIGTCQNLRLYKTGDLGKYLPDGNITFCGRMDHQVKIRGHRIELGEIESLLQSHEDLKACSVTALENRSIAAYIIPGDFEPTETELISYLESKLPAYMVPAHFIFLSEFPLTSSGKIDYKRLPNPDKSERSLEEKYVAPRNEVEQELCLIWQKVLKLRQISIHDNFFKIGGHSLLATQIISRVRSQFQVELPLRDIFEYPTISTFSTLISQSLRNPKDLNVPPILPAPSQELFPLSFAQQRLWFLEELSPDVSAYNISMALEISGPLNIQALAKALKVIIQKHNSLRTVFIKKDGIPFQKILEDIDPIETIELTDTDDIKNRLSEVKREHTHIKFNLSDGPLIRITILKASPEKTFLFLTLHHIISDGWSIGVFNQELSSLYKSYLQKQNLELSPLPIQYTDFTIWQRSWLQGKSLQRQLTYWQNKLDGLPDSSNLPTDFPRPKTLSYKGGKYGYKINKDLSLKIKKLCLEQGISTYMFLLTAFNVLLHKYSGEEDIIVGTPIANRNHKDIEELIGFFVNTLVFRSSVSPHKTFHDLLLDLKEQSLTAYQYQDVPFEQLVDHLNIERALNKNPIFQVMFMMRNANESSRFLELEGTDISYLNREENIAKFDLEITTHEDQKSQCIGLSVEYMTDLYKHKTIERLTQHYETLLKDIVSNIQAPVHTLNILSQKEQIFLLHAGNNTAEKYDEYPFVHKIFEQQAQKNPDRIALVFDDQHITYAQLNQRSNQLAHYLKAQGVGPEKFVGILMEQKIDLIVSLLATIKAGGAYVLLDPKLPPQRLNYILKDATPLLILSNKERPSHLQEGEVVNISTLDFSAQPNEIPLIQLHPHNPIYLIYTSGTTGKPKGVIISHRALSNTMCSKSFREAIKNSKSILNITNLSFDIFNLEIYLPLIYCKKLLLHNKNKEALESIITKQKIDFIQITPSHLQSLAENISSKSLKKISILCGGEAVTKSLRKNILNSLSSIVYGPTETTIWSTKTQDNSISENNAIGKPISNTKVYILDKHLNPVPIGVVGEIYIAGVGLARGYANQPDLTADKFIANPFIIEEDIKNSENLRLYKTGDLGKYLLDGSMEFCGRVDDQIKIRGHRIELGEIEHAISASSLVSRAITLSPQDNNNQKLIAYLTLTQEGLNSLSLPRGTTPYILTGPSIGRLADTLRMELKQSLPDYMIPSHFIFLREFPLTPNGKIDRKKLPVPDKSMSSLAQEYVAPRNEIEQTLCAIWKEVLGLNQIGIHDNFFKIGGHSLLATQIISRIQPHFQVELPLRDIFDNPNISSLSSLITQYLKDSKKFQIPSIVPAPPQELFPLSFAQQRLWFLEELNPTVSVYNIPMVLEISGSLDVQALTKALKIIIQRHDSLRTVFIKKDGIPFQKILPTIDPIEIIEITDTNDLKKKISQTKEDHSPTRFNLSEGPLIRVSILKASPEKTFLFITLHHIISDGWSIGVFNQELSFLYKTYLLKNNQKLPALPIQYTDFTIWQNSWLQGSPLQKQLSYWKNKLDNLPDSLNLLTDFPRPKILSYKGKRYRCILSKELSAKIKTLCLEESISTYMFLFTAFNVLLHKYSGDEDIIVGTPIANRTHKDIESLIGFFVNTLVFRSNVSPYKTFHELLLDLKEQSLAAYQYQDIPFEKLVDHLNVERSLDKNPIFQVMFMMRNDRDFAQPLVLEGTNVSYMHNENNISKFDLEVVAHENPESQCIGLTFEYMTDLYKDETIERLSQHYETLLKNTISNLKTPVHSLSVLPQKEQALILKTWNNTIENYAGPAFIYEIFEQQTLKTPDRIALVFDNQHISYTLLNEKANQLAHYLKEQGVGPEIFVAVLMDRSIDLVISLLAILKAGGAYVPLDPNLPPQRLNYILKDASPLLILSNEKCPPHIQESIFISTPSLNLEKYSKKNLPTLLNPQNPIYLIYTSGTTGKPKGVVGVHSATTQRFLWLLHRYPFDPEDTCCFKKEFSFVSAVWELFGPLSSGIKTIILNKEDGKDIYNFNKHIAKNVITRIEGAPSFIQELFNLVNAPVLKKLNYISTSGEPLSNNLLELIKKKCPSTKLLNLYGPTEYASDVTYYEADSTKERNMALAPIGKPISNTGIYILSKNLHPSPIGVVGEIHVSGEGLARGYINHTDLTADRFIANPFATKESIQKSQNLRLYKTGDLGRYLPDGNIEFCGRIDHQVKIRGYRIEPSEIEQALSTSPLVYRSITLAHKDDTTQALISYIELTPKTLESLALPRTSSPILTGSLIGKITKDLRMELGKSLPDYMIPSRFIFLRELPLTPNGKINRKKLPTPDKSIRTLEEDYVAPRNEIEKELCFIWQEVLEVSKIGIHDSFFSIGGDSIKTVRVISKCIERGFNFQVREMFEYVTIAKMAESLSMNHDNHCFPIEVPISKKINKNNIDPKIFIIHPAGGLAYEYLRLRPYLESYDAIGINNPYFLSPECFSSVAETAKKYAQYIENTASTNPLIIIGYSYGGLIAYELSKYLPVEQVKAIIFIDTKLFNTSHMAPIEHTMHKDSVINDYLNKNMQQASTLASQYSLQKNSLPIWLLRAEEEKKKRQADAGFSQIFSKGNYLLIPGNHNNLFSDHIESTGQILRKIINEILEKKLSSYSIKGNPQSTPGTIQKASNE